MKNCNAGFRQNLLAVSTLLNAESNFFLMLKKKNLKNTMYSCAINGFRSLMVKITELLT